MKKTREESITARERRAFNAALDQVARYVKYRTNGYVPVCTNGDLNKQDACTLTATEMHALLAALRKP